MAMTSTEPPGAGSASAAEEVNALTQIYCGGPILAAVQRARIWPDSKDFLDTPTRARPSEVLAAWEASPPRDDDETRAFVAEWFAPGPPDPATLPRPSLPDWDPRGPPFARERFAEWIQISRGDDDIVAFVRDFCVKVHNLWPHLARAPTANAPDTHTSTLIPTPHVAVVPGERFRETYYWDSYWTVVGLLASGMLETAEGVVRNMLSLVERHGFMPNGARRYYLNRSQPPVLAGAVRKVCEAFDARDAARLAANPPPEPSEDASDSDADDPNRPPSLAGSEPPEVEIPMSDATRLARDALPTLVREHAYWSRPEKIVRVSTNRRDARNAVVGEYADLSRYWAYTDQPRPESWREDVALAEEAGVADDPAARARLWRDVASAAESGHDFGSRWLAESGADVRGAGPGLWKPAPKPCSLATIRTTRVVPADLNGFMLKMEEDIAASARRTRDDAAARGDGRVEADAANVASRFAVAADRRRVVMNRVLWDESSNRWRDVLLEERASDPELAGTSVSYRSLGFVEGARASDFVPLWCGALAPESKRAVAALAALQMSGLVLPGGIATSLRFTGHQWDYPNAWAPLVHVVVEGCREYCGEPGRRFAREIARRWLKGNAQLLKKTGHMHEKYDARSVGSKPGDGGEYAPQRGFGWSNGVALAFAETYCYDGVPATLGRVDTVNALGGVGGRLE